MRATASLLVLSALAFAGERTFKDGKLGESVRISESAESDIWPVAATDSAGNVWIAWQGARGGAFKILTRRQTANGWSPETTVSTMVAHSAKSRKNTTHLS